MVKFSEYKLTVEGLNELHFQESFMKAYEEELNPFPINVQIYFENKGDGRYYTFGCKESQLIFTRKNDEETLPWTKIRNVVFKELIGSWKDYEMFDVYLMSEGIEHLAKMYPKNTRYYGGNFVENARHFALSADVNSEEMLMLLLENVMINTHKKYKKEI